MLRNIIRAKALHYILHTCIKHYLEVLFVNTFVQTDTLLLPTSLIFLFLGFLSFSQIFGCFGKPRYN